MTNIRKMARLEDVADIQLGKMLSPKSKTGSRPLPYLRNQNVQWDRFVLADIAYMDFGEGERERFGLRPGDVLVCEGGEPGRAALWKGQIKECYYQKALHRLRPRSGVMAEYLLFAIWNLGYSGAFADSNAKTTIAHLPLDRLRQIQIPVADETSQHQVVKRLRAQLNEVQSARNSSDGANRLNSSGLRGALLKSQFGDSPPVLTDPGAQHCLNWEAEGLVGLARLESGHTPSRRHPEWWGGTVPWLALPDIRKLHGKVAQATTENINDAGLANSSARLLPVNTVCVSRTASVGFVTMLGRPMATSQDFCNWVCDPERLDPEFLMYAFMASQDYLRELGSGAVHKTIYMPTIQSFHVCAPTIDEQRRIARSLRDQLAAVEALQLRLAERQAEIERLPQRILAAAFGEAD